MSEIWLQHPFTDHDENLGSTSSFTSSMLSSSSDFKHVNNLIDLEKNLETGEFLSDAPSYPTLLLSQENEFINDQNLSFTLPHKKRIPRKLKSISDEKEFQCEICGHCAVSQLDFFSHLKIHYEPICSDINSMKTLLGAIEPKKHGSNEIEHSNICYFEMNPISHVTNVKSLNSNTLESGMSFDNYQNNIKFKPNNQTNELKVFGPSTLKKCGDELEFSDTNDTELENTIRNVVDKVSIEDSCDEIDLIAANGTLRESWFTGGNYPTIVSSPLKADFVQILDDLPTEQPILSVEDDQHSNEITSFRLSKESDKHKTFLDRFLPEDGTTKCSENFQASDTDEELLVERIPKEKWFYCEECKRKFNSGNALKYHIKASHTGIRPHKCDICGRSFFAKGALNSHIRTHTGEKPYECSVSNCQQKFRQWGDLKYHMVSKHSSEKNHQCEFCGKSFARKYSLVLHIRIHENEKNYKCDFCDKAFRAREKPHECMCGKRFRVLGDLRRHYRLHQRQENKTQNNEGSFALKSEENIEVNFQTDDEILGL